MINNCEGVRIWAMEKLQELYDMPSLYKQGFKTSIDYNLLMVIKRCKIPQM